jgi:hypothetical protein
MILHLQRADSGIALEGLAEDIRAGSNMKASDKRRQIRLRVDAEISRFPQISPDPIGAVTKRSGIHRLGGHDKLGGECVATIALPREGPEAFADFGLMQQGIALIQMKASPVIEVAPIIIPSPEIQQVHRSTR